jgi:serine/threonine-protein kinase
MAELQHELQRTLGEGFRVERELGRGGMSRVFIATESRLNRRVVVKVLRPEIAAATSAERFEREILLCARCQHPHIVPLLSAGRVGELPYFTMPLVEGESLRDRLAREGPLPVPEVIRLLIEISDALSYAHRLGVIHRDIKPENILIQDGHAVVADFGVAKALDHATGSDAAVLATSAGIVLGTPAYMAPEQATGDPGVDQRVDLYALGVLAFELLTGQPPFGDLMPPALVTAQLTRSPPSAAKYRKDCPPALASLISRLLATEAAQRPPSAEAVRNELGDIPAGARAAGGRWLRWLFGAGIAALLLGIAAQRWFRSNPAASPTPATKSLAVLPFQNIGGDSSADYFGQGIAEELISALGQLPGLRVASRTSAFAARGKSADLRSIGQQLGVGAVLEGSVQQAGSQVRVRARLVEVAEEAQLWSGDYRIELEDVFAVQDTIARAIARALQLTLAGAPGGVQAALVEQATADQEAHDRYLRGRYFLAQRTAAAAHKAMEYFESALARDPDYALALSGIADGYALLIPFGGMAPREVGPLAKAAALRAVRSDSTRAEVHTSLGFISMWYDWDLREAERRFNRALALNPSYVQAHLFRTWQLMVMGRIDEALESIERARTLDPLSLIVNARKGAMLHFAGRDREAIQAFQYALELDSTFANARAQLGLTLAALGRCREAIALAVPVELMLGNNEAGSAGVVAARCGQADRAREILRHLERWRETRYVSAEALAAIHANLGDPDAAFRELDRAIQERSFSIPLLTIEPMFAPLRADPRWQPLLRRVGLEPGWSAGPGRRGA